MFCGPSLYRIVGALEKQERLLLTNLQPVLMELVRQSDEAAHAAIQSNGKALFIACETGSGGLSPTTAVGDVEPLYCTAIGKSLMCRYSFEQLQQCLTASQLTAYTCKTPADFEAIYQQLQQVQKKGIAIDDGQYGEGVYCLAAPIYNFCGEVIAALGLSGSRQRLQPHRSDYGVLLRRHADSVSRNFGYPEAGKLGRDGRE